MEEAREDYFEIPDRIPADRLVIERYEAEVSMDEYMETCVDVDQFLEYCKQCKNYDRVWSCPSFSFDPVEYLQGYGSLKVVGYKVFVPEEWRMRVCSQEDQTRMSQALLYEPKRMADREMLAMEEEYPNSKALSGGSCLYCQPADCAKVHGKACRFPEKMRYSIEALGGNVGLTVTKHLGQKLEWIEKGRMPRYFIIVTGLLMP